MLVHHPTVSNYTCKYLESTRPVHTVMSYKTSNKVRSVPYGSFYTIPFQSNSKCETFNCVATYLHHEHAQYMAQSLKDQLPEDMICAVETFSLQDIAYYSHMMHTPLITFINSYCNIDDKAVSYDIFYTTRILDHPQDYNVHPSWE